MTCFFKVTHNLGEMSFKKSLSFSKSSTTFAHPCVNFQHVQTAYPLCLGSYSMMLPLVTVTFRLKPDRMVSHGLCQESMDQGLEKYPEVRIEKGLQGAWHI
jgi:hypothetical protein